MKIIFIEDFKNNKAGDFLNVSDGYARNFLIPKFFAIFFKKKINLIYIRNLIILNDLKKKNFFKKLFLNFNNKNIYLNNLKFIKFKLFLYKNFLLKKIGFYYYYYYIIFFKEVNDSFILNIKLYNNIFIKFFIFFN